MTEEEFWKSNPRKILVYKKVWRDNMNEQNKLIHLWVGNYVLNALEVALSQVLSPMLCGKQSSHTYMEEPIKLFEKTEEEKKAEYDMMTAAFIAWEKEVIRRYSKKPDS